MRKNISTVRKPFRMQRLAKLALESTISSNISFVLYERLILCGYTFLHCCLRLSDDEEDFWSPSGIHLCLFPKEDSVLVDGKRYFLKKDAAQRYSMFCAIFQQNSKYFLNEWLPEYLPKKSGIKEEDDYCDAEDLPKDIIRLRQYSVVYDPTATPKSERKNRPPFLGILEYTDGVIGIRLLQPDGTWIAKSRLLLL
jgi:hypothetical protein